MPTLLPYEVVNKLSCSLEAISKHYKICEENSMSSAALLKHPVTYMTTEMSNLAAFPPGPALFGPNPYFTGRGRVGEPISPFFNVAMPNQPYAPLDFTGYQYGNLPFTESKWAIFVRISWQSWIFTSLHLMVRVCRSLHCSALRGVCYYQFVLREAIVRCASSFVCLLHVESLHTATRPR